MVTPPSQDGWWEYVDPCECRYPSAMPATLWALSKCWLSSFSKEPCYPGFLTYWDFGRALVIWPGQEGANPHDSILVQGLWPPLGPGW